MSDYEAELELPIEYVPVYPKIEPAKLYHTAITKNEVASDVYRFIALHGLTFLHMEYFYTPPHSKLDPHCDQSFLHDNAKINWVFGGEGSTMDWYDLLPGAIPKIQTTVVGSQYLIAHPSFFTLKHSAQVGQPSLIHYGIFHGITNYSQPRHTFSFTLGDKQTKKFTTFTQAKEIFKKYVV